MPRVTQRRTSDTRTPSDISDTRRTIMGTNQDTQTQVDGIRTTPANWSLGLPPGGTKCSARDAWAAAALGSNNNGARYTAGDWSVSPAFTSNSTSAISGCEQM